MISIVMPVYNDADTLHTGVRSVLAQTFEDWELIVVNDGSTDDFARAMLPFRSDPRVRVLEKENGGVSSARNCGIRAARSAYICFLDADDEWYPNHLAQIRAMIDFCPEAGLWCTSVHISTKGGHIKDSSALMGRTEKMFRVRDYCGYFESLGGAYFIYTISVCVAQRALARAGLFAEGARIGEDYDLWLRLAMREDFVFSTVVTAVYHRELSTATSSAGGDMDVDWVFQTREDALYADESIDAERRAHLRAFMDRFRVRRARHLLMQGRRCEARETLKRILPSRALRKAVCMTKICMLIPSRVLAWLYRRKKSRE